MQLPVGRDPAARSGHGLVGGVSLRRGQGRAVEVPLGGEVPEPALTGLEAAHDRVAGGRRVLPRVLTGGGVAAADVPALGAAAEVEPPAAAVLAVRAPRAAGRRRRIDTWHLTCWHRTC